MSEHVHYRGGSRISEKGGINVYIMCIKVWKVPFADFITFFLNIP